MMPSGDVERERQLDEVVASYLVDLDEGRMPDRQRLLESFPGLSSALKSFFADLDRFKLAAPVRPKRRNDPPSFPADPPGYELLDEVGHGGMGVVYRARDVALRREVAVKFLSERYSPDSPTGQRFVREACITGQLQHPGIPAVHQVGALADGRPFLAMKLIKGRTLEALLKDRSDPSAEPGRLLAVFEAVCQAVGYAHAHRVLHRDIKPSNIMVGAFGEVQVMDWGLAKVLGEETPAPQAQASTAELTATRTEIGGSSKVGADTQAGTLVGTPAFMAPEQAAGELDKVNERSDVFGLGALLAAILTGKAPYLGANVEEVRLLAVRGKLGDCFARLDASGAERELVALCKKCLAFEPADRPRDAGEVAQAVAELRAAAEERARTAEREKAAAEARVEEQRRKRRWQVAAAGVVVLALVGGILGLTAYLQAQAKANVKLTAENVARTLAEREAKVARATLLRRAERLASFVDHLAQLELRAGQGSHALKTLEEGLQSLQELVAAHPDDESFRRALARVRGNLGLLQARVGQAGAGITQLEQTRRTHEALHRDHPGDLGHALELAKTYVNLAVLHVTAGKPREAMDYYDQARQLLEKTSTLHPKNPDLRYQLAASLDNSANLLEDLGNLTEARKRHEQAIRICRELLVDDPGNVPSLRQLVGALSNLGTLLQDVKETKAAEKMLAEAVARGEELLANNPRDVVAQDRLAAACINLGSLLRDLKQNEKALTLSVRGEQLLRQLVKHDPSNLKHRGKLAAALNNLGRQHGLARRPARALPLFREAAGLQLQVVQKQPRDPHSRLAALMYHTNLARAALNLGDLAGCNRACLQAYELVAPLKAPSLRAIYLITQLARGLDGIGALFTQREQCRAALGAYEKAASLRERLVQARPADQEQQRNLAGTYGDIGGVHRKMEHPEEAVTWLTRALNLWRKLLAREPNNADYLRGLGGIYHTLALTEMDRKQFGAAASAFRLAIDHQQRAMQRSADPAEPRLWMGRSSIGLVAALAREADRLRRDGKDCSAVVREAVAVMGRIKTVDEKQFRDLLRSEIVGPLRGEAEFKKLLAGQAGGR